MGRHSTLDAMPRELRDLFHRLVRDGYTIVDITDKLNELDGDVSRSAVGRAVKSAREQMKRFGEAQRLSATWKRELNENPEGDVGAMCTDILSGIAFVALDQIATQQDDGKGKPVKPMDIMLLAKALQSMEATAKKNLERREKIERMVLERQSKAAEAVAKKQGMSDDQWAAIRAKFLGIDGADPEPA